jgi:hypothetical protein
MNWGLKIVIGYSSFVIMMLTMVVFGITQKIELIETNYYEEEEKQNFKQSANTNYVNLNTNLIIENSILKPFIQLDSNIASRVVSGSIVGKNTSNSKYDFKIEMNKNNVYTLKNKVSKGFYKLYFNWNDGSNSYYTVKEVVFK